MATAGHIAAALLMADGGDLFWTGKHDEAKDVLRQDGLTTCGRRPAVVEDRAK